MTGMPHADDQAQTAPARPPKLAVIITSFNYETYVARAIRSVLDQRHPDCELLVVDDGSSDRSWDVIAQTGVRAIRLTNGGQRAACVQGLDHTTATFILFLDCDDELKPGALATIIGLLDPNVAKIQFALDVIDADGRPMPGSESPLDGFRSREGLANEVLRRGVYKTPPTSGNVIRRDVCALLREADYDRSVDGIILFAAPFYGDVVSIPEALGRYRIHGLNDSGLGRAPETAQLQRELDRFVARLEHLRRILRRTGRDRDLVKAEDAFYFQERSHYLAIAAGLRPAIGHWTRLLATLLREPFPMKTKIGLGLFVVLTSVVPDDRRRSLLAYRLQPGPRSLGGLLRRALMPSLNSTHPA